MSAFVEVYIKDYQEHKLTILDSGSQAIDGQPTYKPFFNKLNWKYL